MGSMLEYNVVHRRSVTVLFMLFKIRSNSMHPLCRALPCMQARITHGASEKFMSNECSAHRKSFGPRRCRTAQYRRTFLPSLFLYETITMTMCLTVLDFPALRVGEMLSCWPNLLSLSLCGPLLPLFLLGVGCLRGVWVFDSLTALHSRLFLIIIIKYK